MAQPLLLLPQSDPFKLLPQGLSQVFPAPLTVFLGHTEVPAISSSSRFMASRAVFHYALSYWLSAQLL